MVHFFQGGRDISLELKSWVIERKKGDDKSRFQNMSRVSQRESKIGQRVDELKIILTPLVVTCLSQFGDSSTIQRL